MKRTFSAYAWNRLVVAATPRSDSSLILSRLIFSGENVVALPLGTSVFIIRPAASEILSFFRGWPWPLTGDVWRLFCALASNNGVETSISAEKSGMLLGRDMIGSDGDDAPSRS